MSINLELEQMYLDDKTDRAAIEKNELTEEELDKRDLDRQQRLKELLENNEIDLDEIWNLHYSALILHHSYKVEDVEKAHDFAKKAITQGSNVTKWLYATTLDRLLVMQGKKQKFGTQFQIVNGEKVFFPIDGSVSVAEKAEFGVLSS